MGRGETEGAGEATTGVPEGAAGLGLPQQTGLRQREQVFFSVSEESGGRRATLGAQSSLSGRGVEFSPMASTFSAVLGPLLLFFCEDLLLGCLACLPPSGPPSPRGVGMGEALSRRCGHHSLGPSSLVPSVPLACSTLGPLGVRALAAHRPESGGWKKIT